MTGRIASGIKGRCRIWDMVEMGTARVFETMALKSMYDRFTKMEDDLRKNEVYRYN